MNQINKTVVQGKSNITIINRWTVEVNLRRKNYYTDVKKESKLK